MRGRRKSSILGIFMGIIWGISIVMIVFGYNERKSIHKLEVPEYSLKPETMLDALDNRDYVSFLRDVAFSKEDGFTEDYSEIHSKLFAVADCINSTAFEQVYLAEGELDMFDYYEEKRLNAFEKTGNLEFVIDEVNYAFINR